MKIQVLERCFTLLDLLREKPQTLSELSAATDVQATTLRNILRTLEELEVVGRDEKKYKLGRKLNDYALPAERRELLRSLGATAVQSLGRETGEHALCVMLSGGTTAAEQLEVLADVAGGGRVAVRSEGPTDTRQPDPLQHLAGRLLIANLPDDEFESWLEAREPFERDRLEALLQPLRGQDSCVEENTTDQSVCIARLVQDAEGKAAVALTIALPFSQFTGERRRKMEAALATAVQNMETNLARREQEPVVEDASTRPVPAAQKTLPEPLPEPVETPSVAMPPPRAEPKVERQEEPPSRRSWAGFRNG